MLALRFGSFSSLILSENTQNVHFKEAKFPRKACPRTPQVYSRLRRSILFLPAQLWTASALHAITHG